MQAIDFFSLAVTLSRQPGSAERRSAISRAYYSAFNRASEVIREIGIVLPKGAECHDKVAKILGNCGDNDVQAVGQKLESLRTNRNSADYHLNDPAPEKQGTVILNLHAAEQIILGVEKCIAGGEKANVQTRMKEYAGNTLRLTVVSSP